jgi:hypothetical protein
MLGGASGAEIIVIQNTRQLKMQKTEIKFTSRSAVLSFDSSALQPDVLIPREARSEHSGRAPLPPSDRRGRLEDHFAGGRAHEGMSRSLLNIEKQSLPRLMLTSVDAV